MGCRKVKSMEEISVPPFFFFESVGGREGSDNIGHMVDGRTPMLLLRVLKCCVLAIDPCVIISGDRGEGTYLFYF